METTETQVKPLTNAESIDLGDIIRVPVFRSEAVVTDDHLFEIRTAVRNLLAAGVVVTRQRGPVPAPAESLAETAHRDEVLASGIGLPTAEEMLRSADREIGRAYRALGEAAAWLRSDWTPVGSCLTLAQANRRDAMRQAIRGALRAINPEEY